jgi:plastocyanin
LVIVIEKSAVSFVFLRQLNPFFIQEVLVVLNRAVLAVAAVLLLCSSAFATEYFVSIPGFEFSPANLTINEGDIVTWTNDHTINHTSTSADGGVEWDSGTLAPGESFSHTFTTEGSYDYLCTIHPSMTGNITVEPLGNVPTLSEWGMILLSLMLIGTGTVAVIRRRRVAAVRSSV